MGLSTEQGKQEINNKCNISTLFCLLGGDKVWGNKKKESRKRGLRSVGGPGHSIKQAAGEAA